MTAKMSAALWQRRRAQRCDSSGSECGGNDVHISVTAMATDTAVTTLSVAATYSQ